MRTQRREGDTTKQEPLVGNTNGTRDRMKVLTKQQRIAELARNRRNEPLTCLHQHIDEDWMEEAYRQTRKDGATGVDGETAKSYEENLKQNLKSLLGRIKSGTYHAPPVRRTYIPKAGGKGQRALGIPTFEDKVAQRAIVMALEPIYEQEFKAFSFGYRKGYSAHGALQYLRNQIMDNSGRWILEVDISRYFDTINHQRLREFLDQRVTDGVIRRMIDKWLRAGVVLLQMKCYKCRIALSYFFTKKRKYHEKRNPTKKATIQRSRKSKNTSTPLIGEESNLGVVRRA